MKFRHYVLSGSTTQGEGVHDPTPPPSGPLERTTNKYGTRGAKESEKGRVRSRRTVTERVRVPHGEETLENISRPYFTRPYTLFREGTGTRDRVRYCSVRPCTTTPKGISFYPDHISTRVERYPSPLDRRTWPDPSHRRPLCRGRRRVGVPLSVCQGVLRCTVDLRGRDRTGSGGRRDRHPREEPYPVDDGGSSDRVPVGLWTGSD